MAKIEINITRKYARKRTLGEMLADFAEGAKTREEIEAESDLNECDANELKPEQEVDDGLPAR